ncbi:MAG: rhodanese-like domain-containing protein [Anaerolineae bacterium]|jgi:rhodanese-related sulfurtransferase|nr:rhodanese-like domain-containing protein [Chloroflexota bacterium]
MRYRAHSLIVLLLLTALLLAACGGGTEEPPIPGGGSSTGSGAQSGGSAAESTGGGSAESAPSGELGQWVEAPGGGYFSLLPEELEALLADREVILINVEPKASESIEGTDLLIPWLEIPQHLGEISDRSADIALYSADGTFGLKAAEKLASFGYSAIHHLEGGLAAWSEAGLTVVPAE